MDTPQPERGALDARWVQAFVIPSVMHPNTIIAEDPRERDVFGGGSPEQSALSASQDVQVMQEKYLPVACALVCTMSVRYQVFMCEY
jgi:hypothetical protein